MPRTFGAAAVLLVSLALSACTPTTAGPTTAPPAAAPTTTGPTPSATADSDAELLEEARATVDAYFRAIGTMRSRGYNDHTMLLEHATPEVASALTSAFQESFDAGYRAHGAPRLLHAVLEDGQQSDDFEIHMAACVDGSAVTVVDSNGRDVTADDRETRGASSITLLRPGRNSRLLVAEDVDWSGQGTDPCADGS